MAGNRTVKIQILGDAKGAQQAFQEAGQGADGFGGKLETLTKGIAAAGAAISVALGALTAIGVKGALDTEAAVGRVQAQLGLTSDEADRLGDIAQAVWQDGFGDSVPGVLEDVATLRAAFGDLSDEELEELTRQFLTIEDLWGAPVDQTAKTVKTLTANFGDLSRSDALDLIALGFQQGGDLGGELLDTLNEYAPAFSNMGLSADQFLGILLAGSEAGAFSIDKVGDAMKEFEIRGQDASEATSAAFTSLGLDAEAMGQAIAQGGEAGERAFQATLAALAAIEDPVARNTAGVALFGTQWEDVGENVVLAMAEGIDGIEGFEGTTERAGDAAYNNLGAIWTSIKRQALGALTNAVTPAVEGVVDVIRRVNDAFAEGGLSGALGEIRSIGSEALSAITSVDWSSVAQVMIDGITGALSSIGSAVWDAGAWFLGLVTGVDWSGVAGSIQDGLIGALTAILDWGGDLVTWFTDTVTGVDWGGLATTVKDAILGAVFSLVDWGQQAVDWFSAAITGVDWATLATTIRDGVVGALGTVDWSALGTTISGGFTSLSESNDTIAGLAEKLGQLLEAAQPLVDFVSDRMQGTFDALKETWDGISVSLSGIEWGPILEALQTLGTIVGAVLVVAFAAVLLAIQGFAEFLSVVLPPIVTAAVTVISTIAQVINLIRDTVVNVVAVVKALLEGDWAAAWEAAKQLVSDLVTGILGYVGTLLTGVLGIIDELTGGALTRFGDWVTDMVGSAQDLYDDITDKVGDLLDEVKQLIEDATAGIQGAWDAITGGIQSSIEGIAEPVRSAINTVIGYINGLLSAWNDLEFGGVTIAGKEIIPSVGTPDVPLIPTLDTGGIVFGPTLAKLAMNSRPEAIIPLDRLDEILGWRQGGDNGRAPAPRQEVQQHITVNVEDRSPAAIANAVQMAGLALGRELEKELVGL